MAKVEQTAPDALTDLAHFEAKTSAEGRLLHYAEGRIRAFWLRQTLTAFGSTTMAVLVSLRLGLLLAFLGIAGEIIDILLLRLVVHRLEHGQTGRAVQVLALGGAGIQGLTIASCVALTWRVLPLDDTRFFGAAFLVSAAINAGLARPLFREAANLRLIVFLLTGMILMAQDLSQPALATSRGYGFFAASFALLVFISMLIIRMLDRSYEQRRSHEHTLLSHQHEREHAQIALARSAEDSERLAFVAKYANDSIIICGPSGKIDWVNDAFTRITGYSYAEAVGQFPSDILNAPQTDPLTLDKLQHARETRSPVRVEILNRTKSGRNLWVETSINPILGDLGQLRLWVAVEREITEAKQREADLAQARLAAEEAGQSKSQFLAVMSHEIRTPMNGVISVAGLLAETPLTLDQRHYVDTILESGRALLAIINDILDLAKLQSGKATLEDLVFSPKSCVESVLRILGPVAYQKGLELTLTEPASDALVVGDEGKLRQIILNLVGNAIKFTQEGSVTLGLSLPSAAYNRMEIAVVDTGIGIAQDRIKTIFESFSQANDGISRRFGGTGLGLTISAMLAEQMGGEIAVHSTLGSGSTFTLRVSLPLATTSALPDARPDRREPPRLRAGLTVMVAEDNRTNMMIVRKMLQGQIGMLIEAENGEQAVAQYKKRPPDLILMDMSMPVKDGLTATRDIRAHERQLRLPHCPVIALTANAFEEDREACRRAGLDGFLVKPLTRSELLAAIGTLCPDLATRPHAIGL